MTNQAYRDAAGQIPRIFYHEPLRILMDPPHATSKSWMCVKDTLREDGTTNMRRVFNKSKQRSGYTPSTSQIAMWVLNEYLEFVDSTIKLCPGGHAFRDGTLRPSHTPAKAEPDKTPVQDGNYLVVDGTLILELSVTSPRFGPLMALLHS